MAFLNKCEDEASMLLNRLKDYFCVDDVLIDRQKYHKFNDDIRIICGVSTLVHGLQHGCYCKDPVMDCKGEKIEIKK